MSGNKQSRRNFLKAAGALVGLTAIGAWSELAKTQMALLKKRIVRFPFNKNKTVSFQDEFIVLNQDGKVKALSAHCTHLGCLINKEQNGKLICPCHGSEYDLNGNPVKGPAYKPLEKYKATLSDDGQQITIET